MNISPPLPKEHGSWAMLIVPLLLGLFVAPVWNGRVLILLAAALGFFLTRYPLAVLVKTRKRPTTDRAYLWRWTAIYGVMTVLCGGWLVLSHQLVWLAVIGLFGAGLLLFNLWLVSRRQELSLLGELTGIAGLALGAPMAYYAASGQLDSTAALLGLINFLYFGGTVFYIKLKVRQQPRLLAPERVTDRLVKAKACLAYQTAALTLLVALAALRWTPLFLPLAFIPMTVKMVYGAWHWQDKKSLSLVRLGVAEIAHAVVFAGLVGLTFVS